MIGLASEINGLYKLLNDGDVSYSGILNKLTLKSNKPTSSASLNSVFTIPSQALWHFRLGHLSNKRLCKMSQLYSNINHDNKVVCDICHFAEHRKLPYPASDSIASNPFELIHFDIWGPLAVHSVLNHKYFLIVLDDYSKYTWIVLLKSKAEVSNQVQNFIHLVENHFRTCPKYIRIGNGPEFLMTQFYLTKGIIHQRSCVESPQQNGRVERKHQHLLNVGRVLLFQSKLPKYFWSYAVSYATYIINRIPTPFLNDQSPYQKLHNTLPDLNHIKIFGSLCYASTLQNHRTKLSCRARKSIFLGYQLGFKGFVLLDIHTNEIFISRNVKFYENILPYHNISSNISPEWEYMSTNHVSLHPPDNTPTNHHQNNNDTAINADLSLKYFENIPHQSLTNTPHEPPTEPHTEVTSKPQTNTPPAAQTDQPSLRTSSRARHPPSHLQDYVCATFHDNPNQSSGTPYPLSNFLSYSHLSSPYCHYILSTTTQTEPKTYNEANKFECWRQAMKVELAALDKTGTWTIVDLPPNIKPIGCKWVYKIKHNSDGSIERFKARLVSKGYNQIKGFDYSDTFSPLAKLTTVRLVLALASIHSWHVYQFDVNNAFLHGELHENVYMVIAPGVTTSKPNQVCKLAKSLYGLKQASRQWYEKLASLLTAHGYQLADSDHSLFVKSINSNLTILLVYVDDVILAGNSISEITSIKHILHHAFKIKDLGILKYFLGLEVAYFAKGITLCQRKYCIDLLNDSGLIGSKPASTPSDPSIKLCMNDAEPFPDIPTYIRLIGRLIYLNTTRPDITHIT